jgi:hypothetical protein
MHISSVLPTVKMGKKRKNKKMKVGFASVYVLTLKGIESIYLVSFIVLK